MMSRLIRYLKKEGDSIAFTVSTASKAKRKKNLRFSIIKD